MRKLVEIVVVEETKGRFRSRNKVVLLRPQVGVVPIHAWPGISLSLSVSNSSAANSNWGFAFLVSLMLQIWTRLYGPAGSK